MANVTLLNVDGQQVTIKNAQLIDGELFVRNKKQPGKSWSNKYPMVVLNGHTHGAQLWGCNILEGWSIVEGTSHKPRTKKVAQKLEPQPEPQPIAEPEPAIEPVQVVEPTAKTVIEPAEPTATQTFTQPTYASMDAMTTMMATMFGGVEKKVVANVMQKVEPIIAQCEQAANKVPIKHIIEVRTPQGVQTLSTGIVHNEFERLCFLVQNDIPTYIYGPAGSGKNVLVAQVAEAMGLKFYYSGALQDEFKLKGYGDATGRYVPTEFYEAFTNGGLFMLDEMDASDPAVLVAINAALSQKYVDFPVHGRVDAHPNFRMVSAGNTFGTGASMVYTGRSSLDGSTLNRFAYLAVDYDERIDLDCANQNQELVDFGHALRKGSKISGVTLLMSYRQFTMMSKLEAQPDMFDTKKAIEVAITKGLQRDELRLLARECDELAASGNKYAKALKEMAMA